MKKLSLGKPFMAPAMLALVLVLGLALVSCDDGSGNGGGVGEGGGLGLYNARDYNYVELTVNARGSFNYRDFSVTIDGATARITGAANEGNISNNTTNIKLMFNTPAVTVSTSYQITVVYSGSAVPPFTREARVTCQAR